MEEQFKINPYKYSIVSFSLIYLFFICMMLTICFINWDIETLSDFKNHRVTLSASFWLGILVSVLCKIENNDQIEKYENKLKKQRKAYEKSKVIN